MTFSMFIIAAFLSGCDQFDVNTNESPSPIVYYPGEVKFLDKREGYSKKDHEDLEIIRLLSASEVSTNRSRYDDCPTNLQLCLDEHNSEYNANLHSGCRIDDNLFLTRQQGATCAIVLIEGRNYHLVELCHDFSLKKDKSSFLCSAGSLDMTYKLPNLEYQDNWSEP